MRTRAQKIRLGIFITISLAILLASLGLFTTQRFLREKDIYYVAYEDVSVSGLEVGSSVKYLGIKVGVISDIAIDPANVNRIIVTLALKPDTPIKEDAQAEITTLGITGLKTIEIRGGTNEARFLLENEFIPPGSSDMEAITGQAEVIAEKAELVLNNLQRFTKPENLDKITVMVERISNLAQQANETFYTADTILKENRQELKATITQTNEVSKRLDSISIRLLESVTAINKIVKSDTIGDILTNTREISIKLKESNLKEVIMKMGEVVDQTNLLLVKLNQDLDKGGENFAESMELLKITLENLKDASRQINQDPSILIRGAKEKNIPDKNLNK